MTMPRFTAEFCLYNTDKCYGMKLSSTTPAATSVEPAGPVLYAACLAVTCPWMGPPCLAACIPAFLAPGP